MRRLLAVVAVALVVSGASACSAPAPPRSAAAPTPPAGPPTLPAPTGGHAVGTTVLHLKDTSRPDPWDPEVKARELRVTLWYPAERGNGRRAPYMTAKESELVLRRLGIAGVPGNTLSRTRTNAVADAEPAGRRLPLVVLSPGLGEPVSMLTSLAEDLASRGYVVAGIDPAYESYAMTLADGRIAECLACDSASDPGFGEEVAEGRAADVSFVLDRLPSVWRGGDRIDLSRVAMVGHLIGGAGAVAAMVKDSRVRAGVDLDGITYARIPQGELSRPFMFIGSDRPAGERDRTWSRDWRLLTGWKRRLVVSGAEPRSFTDYPHTAGALGVQPVYGTLPAARAAEVTRTYVAAFLDRHLKARRQPLLDQPSPRYPEVRFCPAACGHS